MAKRNKILKQVLAEVEAAREDGRTFICVFDLDSTLYDLSRRKEQIVVSFANEPKFRALYPEQCKRMQNIQIDPREFGIREGLEQVGITDKNDAALVKDLIPYWEFYFFHNDFLHYDLTLPGAVEYVNMLHKRGATISYLTGRDEPRMLTGTLKSLKLLGFPMGENVLVELKPKAEDEDHEFKLKAMEAHCEKFDRVWLFENEPVNINLIEKQCPKVEFVYVDLNHSGREEVGPHLHVIKDFLL